jgi:hypothetical protein
MKKRTSMAAYLFLSLGNDGHSVFQGKELRNAAFLGVESGYTPLEALERLKDHVDLSSVQMVNCVRLAERIKTLPVKKGA